MACISIVRLDNRDNGPFGGLEERSVTYYAGRPYGPAFHESGPGLDWLCEPSP